MIIYRTNHPLDPLDIVRVFDNSGIRRPTTDLPRIARMFASPCLVLSAWDGETLIGVSRSLTDFAYCGYLSDLAVDRSYQHQGIGRELVRIAIDAARRKGSEGVILVGDPPYYMPLGFEKVAYNALQFPGPTDPGRILVVPLREGAHDLIRGEMRWRAD